MYAAGQFAVHMSEVGGTKACWHIMHVKRITCVDPEMVAIATSTAGCCFFDQTLNVSGSLHIRVTTSVCGTRKKTTINATLMYVLMDGSTDTTLLFSRH
jgi:hypothetical protein